MENSRSNRRVAVALSGGVDSLVAAFLLKEEYPDLFGIHFTTGYETYPDDKQRVMDIIGAQLNIPVCSVDLKDQFEKEVVSYFTKTYQSGKTPNPCVICNQKIKFGALWQAARDLGADILATGHYAKIGVNPMPSIRESGNRLNSSTGSSEDSAVLLKARDRVKDQSYFLSMLSPEQLSHALFPLGNLTKQEVIAIADSNGLVPIHKKESQDICFIRENSFAEFIRSRWIDSPLLSQTTTYHLSGATTAPESVSKDPFAHGDIITTDNKLVGRHRGLHCYTIGQRRGLNCPGPAPYYVKSIDMEHNRLIVGFKDELFKDECNVININWLSHKSVLSTSSSKVATRIRYSHSGAASTLICQNPKENNSHREEQEEKDQNFKGQNHKYETAKAAYSLINVIFDEPQLAVTPGQCAVFYDGEQVLGAGFIE